MLKKNPITYSTKSSIVLSILRDSIINGNLKPGQRLVLKQIAEELNVSELPVREAIRHLQAEGLVTNNPHTGAVVTDIQVKELIEVLEIRGVLEAYSARLAVSFITKSTLQKMEQVIIQMSEFKDVGDRLNYGKKNREFHELLHTHCPLEKLKEMIEDIRERWSRSRSVFEIDPVRIASSLVEHKSILQAIKENNSDLVEQLMREHSKNMLISFKKLHLEEKLDPRMQNS